MNLHLTAKLATALYGAAPAATRSHSIALAGYAIGGRSVEVASDGYGIGGAVAV